MTRGGRRPSMSALVVSGDGRGSIGFAVGKAKDTRPAILKVCTEFYQYVAEPKTTYSTRLLQLQGVQRAARHMVKIEVSSGKSVMHDVQGKFGSTRVFLRAAPEGECAVAGVVVVVAMCRA